MNYTAQEKFMRIAIDLAREAAAEGNYSNACVIVKDGEIIGSGKNRLKTDHDPTMHGEITAIRDACKKTKDHYLEGCTMYTTLEPCPMCTSAAIWAKMGCLVFGASKEDAEKNRGDGFSWRQIDFKAQEIVDKGTPKPVVIGEFMREECNELFRLVN